MLASTATSSTAARARAPLSLPPPLSGEKRWEWLGQEEVDAGHIAGSSGKREAPGRRALWGKSLTVWAGDPGSLCGTPGQRSGGTWRSSGETLEESFVRACGKPRGCRGELLGPLAKAGGKLEPESLP